MKIWTFGVVLALGCMTSAIAWGQGQTRPAAAAAPRAAAAPTPSRSSAAPLVAVIDIAQVFKNHSTFKQKMEALKGEIESFDQELMQQQRELAAEREKLQGYRAGTQEYRQIEEGMTRMASELQVRAQLKRKELLEREAKIYYDTYAQITTIVGQVADANSIGLVLRYDSDKIDPQDRASVMKGVNRGVVFQRNLDITSMVLERVSQPAVSSKPGTAGAGARR